MDKNDSARPQAPRSGAGGPSLLTRLGGPAAVQRWVERFYDKVARDPVLAPVFPADLASSREKQHAYFVEFFGGEPLYTQRYGRPFLRFKHRSFRIGRPERDAWMTLVMESLAEELTDAETLAEVKRRLAPMADAMINHHPEKKDAYYFN